MGRSKAGRVAVCSNCARLERELHQLREELAELRRQINRNSGNSSVPPSANPPWAPGAVKKKPTGRPAGGQVGHEGHFRELLPVEQVDQVVRHRPARCRHCGTAFEAWTPQESVAQRHQVTELPRVAVSVTEHQAIACRCGQCGRVTKEPIPQQFTVSVLGPRLSAAATFVSARVHGSRRAVEELLEEVLGAPLALGTVMAREQEMTAALNQPYREAKEAIGQAGAKNVDETGWKRAGRFLWVAATPRLAVFHLDPCRNRDALHALLGPSVRGTICTDRFGVYEKVPLRQRALCWAHLKRDFQQLVETGGPAGVIGRGGKTLCRQVQWLWRRLRAGQIGRSTLRKNLGEVRRRMRMLLQRGTHGPDRRAAQFCRALRKLEPALWTFARVAGIEPTNNHAERMLRPAVMWRKQSQGSHSLAGCRFVERIMTAVQTLRLTGRSVMDYLEQAVRAWRHGLPPPPLLA